MTVFSLFSNFHFQGISPLTVNILFHSFVAFNFQNIDTKNKSKVLSLIRYLCDTFIGNKLAAILFQLVTSVRSTAVSETAFGYNKEAFHHPYKLQYKRRLMLSFRSISIDRE